MAESERYVLVCTNVMPDDHPLGCCTARGSFDVIDRLRELLAAAEKDGGPKVRIGTSGCFGRCENGPVMVVYPEGVAYGRVGAEEVDRIVREHLLGGRPVEGFRLPGDQQTI